MMIQKAMRLDGLARAVRADRKENRNKEGLIQYSEVKDVKSQ